MGRRERMHEQVEQQAATFLGSDVLPGERIMGTTICKPRRMWLRFALIGALGSMATRHHLVLTDRRVLLIRLSRGTWKPQEVVLAEPYANLRLEQMRTWPLTIAFTLRRVSDDSVYRLRAQRTFWGASARVRAVAEALAGAHGPVRPA